ncbi:short-chain dehydrogenase [Hypericibacter terrae]|uniref:Short-chain dehydrogenase n=1 Tax=Hypericibacter terrae TaxID=2602015 RepID=A0A5J6MYT5_9PROT|nr:SDR family NAD(P)-dependent oxidoreductase [Hypericibacter terrae]QEX19826.1 short-chain dehydrogenase [Hypericibacter terrae]
MSTARHLLVLGATSAIAQAYARRCAGEGLRFTLVGRRESSLREIASDLVARGAAAADVVVADLADVSAVENHAEAIRSRFGEPDEILIAHGVLGRMPDAVSDLSQARRLLEANFSSAVLWTLALLKNRKPDAPLSLIALGSVAGDRGRAKNPVYDAAKGGLDIFLQGLQRRYDGSPVRILIVKPGPVDTPMTATLEKKGPFLSSPDRVAADIRRAALRGQRILYTPWIWCPIMLIIRHLPWFVFRRLRI